MLLESSSPGSKSPRKSENLVNKSGKICVPVFLVALGKGHPGLSSARGGQHLCPKAALQRVA